MKRFLILIALIGFAISVSATNIVLRGTHKVCGGGAELILRPNGASSFWFEGQMYNCSYSINIADGYLHLMEDGKRVFTFKVSVSRDQTQVHWVDVNVGGVSKRLTKGGC